MGRQKKQRKAASTTLSTYRPLIDQALFVLAIVGVIVTVHLWIQQGRGFDQGCWGFNPPSAGEVSTFNCEAVVTSDAGKMFGISNVYWGMGFYALLSILGFMVGRAEGTDIGRYKKMRAGFVGLGFLYSLYLVNVQVNGLGEYCALCLTSAAIMTLMFLVMLYDVFTSKNATSGTPALQLYKIAPIVAVVLIGADLLYFNNLDIKEAPAVAAATTPAGGAAADPATSTCSIDTRTNTVRDFKSLLSSFDATYGPENAAVTVVEFFDPNCPSCQATHPIIKEVIAKYQDSVRFHLIPFPLRESSLAQIEALYVAKEDGKFFDMLDAQMAMQETRGLSPDRVRELATLLQMDVPHLNSRWRSGLYREKILSQRQKIAETGMSSVPTILVNGVPVLHKTVDCLSQFIDNAAS